MGLRSFIALRVPSDRYAWWVGKGMDRAYKRAMRKPTIERRPVEVDQVRAVVFSDHHRGVGDGADDFRRCEEAYAAALGWYLENGYELWLLGDVEELWKNRTAAVMKRYEDPAPAWRANSATVCCASTATTICAGATASSPRPSCPTPACTRRCVWK